MISKVMDKMKKQKEGMVDVADYYGLKKGGDGEKVKTTTTTTSTSSNTLSGNINLSRKLKDEET